MTEEQKAAYINARAAELNATIQGMVAENLWRVQQGLSLAYGESDFARQINMSGCTHNACIQLFHDL